MKKVEFTRVFWTEWASQPSYKQQKMAELTNEQMQKYSRLTDACLTEAAEYAEKCHQQNLIKYANSDRVLFR